MKKETLTYLRNQVMRSSFSGRFFFVRKARDLGNGVCQVVGQKIDITESIQPFLLKKYRAKP